MLRRIAVDIQQDISWWDGSVVRGARVPAYGITRPGAVVEILSGRASSGLGMASHVR